MKLKVVKSDFKENFNLLAKSYDDFYMLSINDRSKILHWRFLNEIIRVNTALIYNSLEWIKRI